MPKPEPTASVHLRLPVRIIERARRRALRERRPLGTYLRNLITDAHPARKA
jgi:hypothetical protein